jgi:hypothetical protein
MKMLSKVVSGITIALSAGQWSVSGATPQEARVLIQAPNYCLVAQSTYFDLAGMAMDDKTLFIKLAQVQRYFPPTLTSAATGDSFDEMMIMSSHPLSDTELISASADVYSVYDFNEIVYASCRRYVKTLDEGGFASPVLLHDNITSGAEATASDRIYCYRLSSPTAVTPGAGVDAVTLASVNFVIVADSKEEPEYQYLMRLMRSYQLQNEPDRD